MIYSTSSTNEVSGFFSQILHLDPQFWHARSGYCLSRGSGGPRGSRGPGGSRGLPEAPVDPDWPEALRQLAEIMFLRPGELPIASGKYCERLIAKEITCGLVIAVRVAIRDLFDDEHPRRASICRSPERPDLQLSQEEAIGYLLADTLGRPMLAEADARPLGKRVDSKVTAVLKQLAAAPKAAAESARKAAAAAAKNGVAFDVKQHAAAHERNALSALLAKAYDPKMPNATVGRKRTAAELMPPPPLPRPTLVQLQAAQRKAQAAAETAAALCHAQEAAVERAERRRAALGRDPWESAELYGEVSDRVRAAALLESEYEHEWVLDFEMIILRTDTELDRLRLPWAEADAAVDAAKDELIEI